MTRLIFLGSGGGRFATISQARATGGLYLEGDRRIHIDPGPGALVHLHRAGLDPAATDALLVSHCHPDHCVDAPVLLEALNPRGDNPRGVLAGSASALEGLEGQPPGIHPYFAAKAERRLTMATGAKLLLGPIVVEATPSNHSDPTTVGFKIHTNEGIISYLADTAFDEGLARAHKGARVLILPTTTPNGDRIRGHLCTEDSQALIEAVKPEIALLNHFGLRILRQDPGQQAARVSEATGILTLAVEDFMTFDLAEQIRVGHCLEPAVTTMSAELRAPDFGLEGQPA